VLKKGARDRKRRQTRAKVEGRKSIAERRPETVAKTKELAKAMAAALPKGRKPSLRDISAALAEAGHMTPKGVPYSASAIARMLEPRYVPPKRFSLRPGDKPMTADDICELQR